MKNTWKLEEKYENYVETGGKYEKYIETGGKI